MAYGAVLGQKPNLKNLESTVTISGNQPTALELENTAGSVNVNFQAGSQNSLITYNTNDSFSLGANTAVAGNLSNTGTFTSQGAISSSSTISASGIITGRGFNASSQKITNVATPTVNTDGANKQYVDNQITALDNSLTQEITANSSGWQLIRTWGTGNVTVPSQYRYVKVEIANNSVYINQVYGYSSHDYKDYYYTAYDAPSCTVFIFSASSDRDFRITGEGYITSGTASNPNPKTGHVFGSVGSYNSSSRIVNLSVFYNSNRPDGVGITENYTYRIFGSP